MTKQGEQPATADYRILKAIRLIERGDPMAKTATELAREVGVSPYHFNRLFHRDVGETVTSYKRHHYLERAAMRLRWSRDSITRIGEDMGYSSQEAFTRAFCARFGKAPARYRRAMHESQQDALQTRTPCDVIVKTIPCTQGYARRYVGPYTDVPKHWQAFLGTIAALDLALRGGLFLGLIYDDPKTDRAQRLRYDCFVAATGAAVDRKKLRQAGLSPYATEQGQYASAHHEGDYARMTGTYYRILEHWLPDHQRYALGDGPAIETYSKPPVRDELQHLAFDILLPLR